MFVNNKLYAFHIVTSKNHYIMTNFNITVLNFSNQVMVALKKHSLSNHQMARQGAVIDLLIKVISN
jgi:hypothetical protein